MKHRLLPLAAAVLAACGGGPGPEADTAPVTPAPRATEAAAATITPEDMRRRIGVLAHDSMRGRDTPSPGLEAAARYLAAEFARMGLRGGAEDGSFLQRYPFPLVGVAADRVRLAFSTADGEIEVDAADYVALPGETAAGTAGLVFVGAAGSFEAAAGSLRNRVAVVYLPDAQPTRAWRLATNRARRVAQEAGAIGVIAVLDSVFSTDAFPSIAESAARPRRTLGQSTEIPLFHVRWSAARPLFEAAGLDVAELRDRAVAGAIEPVPFTGVTGSVAAPVRVIEDARPPNVVAVLPGSDPTLRDTYVVFSAHMDHVGVGRPDASGDSIYNGADDDASGTAALLEMAEAFAALPRPPLRSLIFLAVSGEEKGLLGSRWYSENPTVPIESIVANVNMDMVARNSPDTIVVIGQEYSSLGPLVHAVAAENPDLGLVISPDIWPEERFFFRSDHFNFARKEIPALFFFSGVHEDYHRPSDEVEVIDALKAARVARLAFLTAHEIASRPEAPVWTPEGLAEVRALTR